MVTNVHFLSKTIYWETPIDMFNSLDKVHRFTLDVCANRENAKCFHYYNEEQNGLLQDWSGVCWMNPPYGNQIGKWIEKAYNESRKGAKVVALLPARTDTRWFHNYILNKAKIEFIKGRLKFGNALNSAPFPSMIVIWE